jgi:hypothetical protein
VRTAVIAATGKDTAGYPAGPAVASDENAPLAHLKEAGLQANPVIARLTSISKSPVAGKFEVQSRNPKSVAQQIASRAAAGQVPQGAQTREEMDRVAAEHTYRQAWTAGNQAPLLSALQRGDINKQRADELIREASMSDLARTVHSLHSLPVAFRVYDAGTPAEQTDLRIPMILKLQALEKSSPVKAVAAAAEYRKRGLIP